MNSNNSITFGELVREAEEAKRVKAMQSIERAARRAVFNGKMYEQWDIAGEEFTAIGNPFTDGTNDDKHLERLYDALEIFIYYKKLMRNS